MVNSLELNNSLNNPYNWHYNISVQPYGQNSFTVLFPDEDAFANNTFWGGRVYINYLNSTNSTAIENNEVRIQVLDVVNFVGHRQPGYMATPPPFICGTPLLNMYYLAGSALLVIVVIGVIILIYKKRK
jgi:phosphatidylethanolamine-binding protein (PEBP) family uncharacterized protein